MLAHISLLASSFWLLNQIWMVALIAILSAFSLYYSYCQYLAITNSSDDLCWTGENWLMHSGIGQNSESYLELLPTSWITPQFCLLKFIHNEQQKAWFFTRNSLGERLFRELCYMAKLSLNKKSKSR